MQHPDLLLQHRYKTLAIYLWNIWNTWNIRLQHAFQHNVTLLFGRMEAHRCGAQCQCGGRLRRMELAATRATRAAVRHHMKLPHSPARWRICHEGSPTRWSGRGGRMAWYGEEKEAGRVGRVGWTQARGSRHRYHRRRDHAGGLWVRVPHRQTPWPKNYRI
jgi:hypothetical protein